MSSVPCMLTENLSIFTSRAPDSDASTPVPVHGDSSSLGLAVSLTALAWLALAAARRLSRPMAALSVRRVSSDTRERRQRHARARWAWAECVTVLAEQAHLLPFRLSSV